MQVILDSSDARLAFTGALGLVRADRPDEVLAALAALQSARAAGRWLAGFFSYELGYALEPRLAPLLPQLRATPLLQFGIYDRPAADARPAHQARAYAGPLRLEWDEAAYGARFAAVKEAIAAGDIYQANLSFRAGFAFAGDPRALYEKLRGQAQAPHCAYVDDGLRQIVSLSPELFFEIESGAIRARPMKGTALRLGNGDDEAERARLAASAKDRAENLMIVDLIRNDLGRVAETGSVAVADLFRVETYPSLHTMVSTVTARLRPDAGIADIVRALFPCGSITGAPKIKAMEILRRLESSPRGAYCGAIGFFAPSSVPAHRHPPSPPPGGEGRGEGAKSADTVEARFNVSIRTLTIKGDAGQLGIGGGVVQDSTCASEYAECLLKSRFYSDARKPLQLIETLKHDNDFVRLERHLSRMAASALVFGLAFDAVQARAALEQAVRGRSGPLRVRLTLDEAGAHRAESFALPANPPHWSYAISPQRIVSGDLLLRHKTDWRELYDSEGARLKTDEVIFLNERGEVCEGARSNIFVKRGAKLLTPALSCGLLPGILRAELLETEQAEEAVLREGDLTGEFFFGNSLRGLIPAKLT